MTCWSMTRDAFGWHWIGACIGWLLNLLLVAKTKQPLVHQAKENTF